jgi:hypothetical protein
VTLFPVRRTPVPEVPRSSLSPDNIPGPPGEDEDVTHAGVRRKIGLHQHVPGDRIGDGLHLCCWCDEVIALRSHGWQAPGLLRKLTHLHHEADGWMPWDGEVR